MEYALGTSDREPGPGEAFDLARTTGGSLILTYPWNPAADDVSIAIESSPDLEHWDTTNPWTATAREAPTGGPVRVTVTSQPGMARHQFVRLRVTTRG